MIKFIKQLLSAKIQITINLMYKDNIPGERITPNNPKLITINKPPRDPSRAMRFMSEISADKFGKVQTWYYTEEWDGKRWDSILGTYSHDKDDAMKKYLDIAKAKQKPAPPEIKAVLWEGLSLEEASAWAALQQTEKSE